MDGEWVPRYDSFSVTLKGGPADGTLLALRPGTVEVIVPESPPVVNLMEFYRAKFDDTVAPIEFRRHVYRPTDPGIFAYFGELDSNFS